MIRISYRDTSYKDTILEKIKKKYPPAIQKELLSEFLGNQSLDQFTVDEEQFKHLNQLIDSLNLKYAEPRDISLEAIQKDPSNKSIMDRLRAYGEGKVTSDPQKEKEGYEFIRNPQNIEKYKAMDPSTQPPIAVRGESEVMFGFHRTITSILRGDKTIKAWVFE